jgi:uncharacterized protein (TIGR02246 family)
VDDKEDTMPPTHPANRRPRRAAGTPAELYGIIQDAVNAADLEAFLGAHDHDASVVLPPHGQPTSGREELRTAIVTLFGLRPTLTMEPVKELEGDDLALLHGRWRLTINDHATRTELSGLGTMVARRGSDGAWRVALDDPLTGP